MIIAAATRLTLMAGPERPVPPPDFVMEAFDSAEIAISDRESSGFSLVFKVPKSGPAARIPDHPGLKAGARVVLIGHLGARMHVLLDGIVEDATSAPGEAGASATLTVMGRDLVALFDRDERLQDYPGMAPGDIARQIITRYASKSIIPDVRPVRSADRDLPAARTPVQSGTDLAYLTELAERFDHVFAIVPGPVPGMARAYWGPPPRSGQVQPAITVDMGAETNASNIEIDASPGEAVQVTGEVLDPGSGRSVPVQAMPPERPALSVLPARLNPATVGTRLLQPQAGQSASQALAQATAQADRTSDVVTVKGELDLGAYGRVLQVRKLVGLRGVGLVHDGLYAVASVVHSIRPGRWTQAFSLVRDGTGTTVMTVRV